MFVQVIVAKARDAQAAREASDRWQSELRDGAKGYLGVTSGVADDNTFVAVVRFDSPESARANSERPEQGTWWEDTAENFEGDPTFYDCPEADLLMGGGSDEAGFVQLMIYRPKDVGAVKEMAKAFEAIAPMRPDIMGGLTAYASDGTVVDVNYFTSEADARRNEQQPMQPDVQALMQRFGENAGEIRYIDLTDPWLH